MDVYIVVADAGQCSDKEHWYVAAYLDFALAHAHARKAQKYADKAPPGWGRYQERRDYAAKNPFDPNCVIDWPAPTKYSVMELPIEDWATFKEAKGE